MKKTTHSLDAKSDDAIKQMAEHLGISKAEVVRRCAVACARMLGQPDRAPPKEVSEGYGNRSSSAGSKTVDKSGDVDRAPPLRNLPSERGELDTAESVASSEEGSPEGDKRRREDQDRKDGSLLDTRIF